MTIAVAAAVTLAACSGGAAGPRGASPGSTLHDVPDGSRLQKVLLSASDLPPGFSEEASAAQNSGATLSDAKASVDPSSADCETILNTIGHTGFGEASYASDAFTPASAFGEFDETVLEFHRQEAAAFMTRLRGALMRCSTFKATDATGSSSTATLSVSAGPKAGDESLGFTIKVVIAGETLVEHGAVARVGTAVLVVDSSSIQGSAVQLDPFSAATVLARRLVALR